MKSTRLAALNVVLLFLVACAATGLQPADTFNKKLAYAYGVHTTVLQATTDGVTKGTIPSADAESVLKQADNAKVLLDAATAANNAGDATGANNKLALATAALNAIQQYLNAHPGGP